MDHILFTFIFWFPLEPFIYTDVLILILILTLDLTYFFIAIYNPIDKFNHLAFTI